IPPMLKMLAIGQRPLGRTGQPEEVAQTALFLASDDCWFFTGQWLPPNGRLGTIGRASRSAAGPRRPPRPARPRSAARSPTAPGTRGPERAQPRALPSPRVRDSRRAHAPRRTDTLVEVTRPLTSGRRRRMPIGEVLRQKRTDWAGVLDCARHAEEAGADSVWV